MASPKLLDLPVEILTAICQLLCTHCDELKTIIRPMVEDDMDMKLPREHRIRLIEKQEIERVKKQEGLKSLGQTSRLLRRIALPIRYHYIGTLRPGYLETIKTLYSRNDVALAVRRVTLGDEIYGPTDAQKDVSVIGEETLRRIGIQIPDRLPHQEYQSMNHFQLDTILVRTTNIEHLDIWVRSVEEYGAFLPEAITFPHLRFLDLTYYDTEGSFCMDRVFTLLHKTPNLEEMKTWMCNSFAYVDPPLLHMKSIEMAHSNISADDLDVIAHACPRLETFLFETNYGGQPYDARRDFTGRDACEMLLPLKDTLRRLELNLSESLHMHMDEDDGPEIVMTDLRQFRALQTLRLSVDCVYDDDSDSEADEEVDQDRLVNLLPSSIQVFDLRSFCGENEVMPRHMQHLLALARAVSESKFPYLRQVCVSASSDARKDDIVREAFASTGVEYVM
jgi:hypothetical protein